MDSKEFVKFTRRQASRINSYIDNQAPAMVVRKTLRFIDGNFRAQGWQGATFQPWKDKASNAGKKRPGRILIVTGRLRRGTNYSTNGHGEVRFYNNVIYAKIHNEGGTINKSVNVRAFTRRRFTNTKVRGRNVKQTTEHEVQAHMRKMKIQMPQRQFAPYESHESPVLNNSITRELTKEIKKLLTF